MKAIGNILLLIFVIGTIYFVSKNNDLVSMVKGLYNQGAEQVGKLANFDMGSFADFKAPTFGGADTSIDEGSDAEVATTETLKTTTTPKTSTPKTTTTLKLPGPLSKLQVSKVNDPVATSTDTEGTLKVGNLSVAGVVARTNMERAINGNLVPLKMSAVLNSSAQVKAQDIINKQYFEHTAPDGTTVGDLVSKAGYVYIQAGENLALGIFKDDQDVVTAWMNSPGHRANILTASYADMGVGIAYGMYEGVNVYSVVQHFGRPRSACPLIPDTMRLQVENGIKELTTIEKSLSTLRVQIEQGRASGEDVSTEVDIYNQGIDNYENKYKQIDILRGTYNALVAAFNSCLTLKL